jgi:hypothetical protein
VPLEATLIPLDQLIPELLLALGGAFLLGNLAAYVRLRSAWRETRQGKREGADAAAGGAEGGGRRPSSRPAARASGVQGAGTTPAGARTGSLPSRTRVLVNVLVGLVVTVASLAALIARG